MTTLSRGAQHPEASDGNNAPLWLQRLAQWVNDRPGVATLTTTQRNALTGVDLWAGRVIFNTTLKRLEIYTGSAWTGSIPTPGRILANAYLATTPSASVFANSSDDEKVDVPGSALTFTAPASGEVWLEVEGLVNWQSTSNLSAAVWFVLDAANTVAGQGDVIRGLDETQRHRLRLKKTGLTPGTAYTYKWTLYCNHDGDDHGLNINQLLLSPTNPASFTVIEA